MTQPAQPTLFVDATRDTCPECGSDLHRADPTPNYPRGRWRPCRCGWAYGPQHYPWDACACGHYPCACRWEAPC